MYHLSRLYLRRQESSRAAECLDELVDTIKALNMLMRSHSSYAKSKLARRLDEDADLDEDEDEDDEDVEDEEEEDVWDVDGDESPKKNLLSRKKTAAQRRKADRPHARAKNGRSCRKRN